MGSQLQDRFVLQAAGGPQHSIILAWKEGQDFEVSLKRKFEDIAEDEEVEKAGDVSMDANNDDTMMIDSGVATSSGPTKIQKLSTPGVAGGFSTSFGAPSSADRRDDDTFAMGQRGSSGSPPRKRAKMVFARKVVDNCLK